MLTNCLAFSVSLTRSVCLIHLSHLPADVLLFGRVGA